MDPRAMAWLRGALAVLVNHVVTNTDAVGDYDLQPWGHGPGDDRPDRPDNYACLGQDYLDPDTVTDAITTYDGVTPLTPSASPAVDPVAVIGRCADLLAVMLDLRDDGPDNGPDDDNPVTK